MNSQYLNALKYRENFSFLLHIVISKCLERNMSGMYKQLDQWIKSILPVLPDSSLQVIMFTREQQNSLYKILRGNYIDLHIQVVFRGSDPVFSRSLDPDLGQIDPDPQPSLNT